MGITENGSATSRELGRPHPEEREFGWGLANSNARARVSKERTARMIASHPSERPSPNAAGKRGTRYARARQSRPAAAAAVSRHRRPCFSLDIYKDARAQPLPHATREIPAGGAQYYLYARLPSPPRITTSRGVGGGAVEGLILHGVVATFQKPGTGSRARASRLRAADGARPMQGRGASAAASTRNTRDPRSRAQYYLYARLPSPPRITTSRGVGGGAVEGLILHGVVATFQKPGTGSRARASRLRAADGARPMQGRGAVVVEHARALHRRRCARRHGGGIRARRLPPSDQAGLRQQRRGGGVREPGGRGGRGGDRVPEDRLRQGTEACAPARRGRRSSRRGGPRLRLLPRPRRAAKRQR